MADVDFELLISVTTGLGKHVDIDRGAGKKVFRKDADCLNCLKDLSRFLHRDDPDTRDVFFELCRKQVPTTHLIPILITYPDDRPLVFTALKVLTRLTMPVNLSTDQAVLQVRRGAYLMLTALLVCTHSAYTAVGYSRLQAPAVHSFPFSYFADATKCCGCG